MGLIQQDDDLEERERLEIERIAIKTLIGVAVIVSLDLLFAFIIMYALFGTSLMN